MAMKPGDLIGERYELREPAGRGGMGQVFRALDRRTGRPVAVKILHSLEEEAAGRFEREVRTLALLNHPGIVRYAGHGVAATGEPFLAMEWIEGPSLAGRLKAGALAAGQVMALAERLAGALAHAHELGMVHRDLKPGNILLPRDDPAAAVIADFGLVRWLADPSITTSGMILGTPSYLAPEQAQAGRQAGPSADTFALGCVLYECLTGERAFPGDNLVAVLAKILLCEPPPVVERVPATPLPLAVLITQLLAKDPAQRPASMAEIAVRVAGLRETAPAGEQVPSGYTLSTRERRLLSVVVLHPSSIPPPRSRNLSNGRLDELARAHPCQWHRLAGGAVILTLSGAAVAIDQACRAARCALALQAEKASCWISIATGAGEVSSGPPLGAVIDQAVGLVDRIPSKDSLSGGILLDEVTAGLIHGRFAVSQAGDCQLLLGEADPFAGSWQFLGRTTPFIGRERELALLLDIWQEVTAESTVQAVLVTGPPGQGKSRLLAELLQKIRESGPDGAIWLARGDPMRAGAPFGLLAALIRNATGIVEGTAEEDQLAILQRRLSGTLSGETVTMIVSAFHALLGLGAASAHTPTEARLDPVSRGDQALLAFQTWLEQECRRQPLLMVIDDAHWGDLPSFRFLEVARRNLSRLPLLVAGFARPDFHEQFAEAWQGGHVHQLRLGPLPRRAGEGLVRQLLEEEPPPPLVDLLLDLSEGNPFFLEELLRYRQERLEDSLPGSLVAMLQARLAQLPATSRRFLRAASVFGQTFRKDGARTLAGLPAGAPEIETCLDALEAAEMIRLRPGFTSPARREFEFRHAFLREAAYDLLTPEDRVLGHRLAADWLAAAGERNARVLAGHYELGERPSEAIHQYAEAAHQALRGNDLAAAIHCAKRGEALGATGEKLGRLYLSAAEALDWQGQLVEGEAAAIEAAALLPSGSAEWFAALAVAAETAGSLGALDRVERLAGLLRPHLATGGKTAGMLAAGAHIAVKLYLGGHPAPAEQMRALLGKDAAAGPPLQRAWLARWDGFRALAQGDYAGFFRSMVEAAVCFETAGDPRNACLQRGNAGYACGELGDYVQAGIELHAALDKALRLGLEGVAASIRCDLGLVCLRQGRIGEALATAGQAAAVARQQGEQRMEATARIVLALGLLQRHDLAAALAEAGEAVQLGESIPPTKAYALAVLARVHLAAAAAAAGTEEGPAGSPAAAGGAAAPADMKEDTAGTGPVLAGSSAFKKWNAELDQSLTAAAAAAESGLAILRELGSLDAGESLLWMTYLECLRARGDTGAFRAGLAEARESLRRRAARISDPEGRAGFLSRIPENAWLMGQTDHG